MIIANSIYVNIPNDLQRRIYNAGFVDMDHKQSKSKSNTLIDKASLLSGSGGFNPLEWQLTGAEFCQTRTSCVCGQGGLKHRYVMTNKATGYSISVGGNCLFEHFSLEPPSELIEFSKQSEAGKPYVWLGLKYDAFIFSSLGFKKASMYFCWRKHGQSVPREYNQILTKDLSVSLFAYNSKKWQEKYERGVRLLARIRNAKYYKGTSIKSSSVETESSQTFEGMLNVSKKRINTLISLFKSRRGETSKRSDILHTIETALKQEKVKISESIYYIKENNRKHSEIFFADVEREIISLRGLVQQESRSKESKKQVSLSEGDFMVLKKRIDDAQGATQGRKFHILKITIDKYYEIKDMMKRLGISSSPETTSQFGKLMRPIEGMMPALIKEFHRIETDNAKPHKKEEPKLSEPKPIKEKVRKVKEVLPVNIHFVTPSPVPKIGIRKVKSKNDKETISSMADRLGDFFLDGAIEK